MSGNLFDIQGRAALLTGANAGIGLGYAEAIASQGGWPDLGLSAESDHPVSYS